MWRGVVIALISKMDFLNFVIALDKELGVAVPETDYQKLSTLDGRVEYLASRHQC